MKTLVALLILTLTNLTAFSTTNIGLLHGDFNDNSFVYDTKGYKTTVTLEHYRTFAYGDVFAFADYATAKDTFKYHNNKSGLYGEISPRLSLSKLSSKDLSNVLFKDIYIATQYNAGEDYKAYLYGLGSDLNIPGFNVFGLNVYQKNQSIGENTYQVSANYISKTVWGNLHLSGFFDKTKDDFLMQNQILLNLAKPSQGHNLYIGVEHHYYTQKRLVLNFNTKVRSNTLQAIIKYAW